MRAISFCNGISQRFEFPDYILNNMRESALDFEAEYLKSNRGSLIQSVPGASLKALHNQNNTNKASTLVGEDDGHIWSAVAEKDMEKQSPEVMRPRKG